MLTFFLQFNERLSELYPELFRGSSGAKSQSISNFGEKWGWYQNIYAIAKGDIFRFEEVEQLKLHKALIYLSFEADKNRLESELIKQKR